MKKSDDYKVLRNLQAVRIGNSLKSIRILHETVSAYYRHCYNGCVSGDCISCDFYRDYNMINSRVRQLQEDLNAMVDVFCLDGQYHLDS